MVLVLSIQNGFYKIKKSMYRASYAWYDKMLKSKIVHLKEIYKFYFDHFLEKRTVFVLYIKNGFYKIKKCIFRPKYARFEKMLTSEVVYLTKIYKFYFYNFLIKRTVFVLYIKNGFYKIKKCIFRPKYARDRKRLTNKIVHLKKIYKFDFYHFLIKRTVVVLSIKNGFYKI